MALLILTLVLGVAVRVALLENLDSPSRAVAVSLIGAALLALLAWCLSLGPSEDLGRALFAGTLALAIVLNLSGGPPSLDGAAVSS